MAAQFIGIDPLIDDSVFKLSETVQKGGEYLKPDEYGILLGKGLARELSVGVGQSVIISTKTRWGGWQDLELTVKGLLDTPNPVINKTAAYIPLSVIDRDLLMEGAVIDITAAVDEWTKIEKITDPLQKEISAIDPDLIIKTWKELGKDFIIITQTKSRGSAIILFVIFIIAAVGISNTMMMAVFERIKEIGMMRALGMKDGAILVSFFIEAGGIGLIGTLSGILLGLILNYFLVTYGLDFSGILGDMDVGYRVVDIFRGAWHPESYIVSLIFGTAASVLISFIPAKKALKMEITTALRTA